VIEFLDDNKGDALNEGIRNDTVIKIIEQEPKIDNDVAGTEEPQQIIDQPRRSRRERIHEDYELYVIMEDEEEFMLTMCKANTNNQVGVKNDDGALKAVAHYIMVHYGKKEMLKK
jgi:hypothetical protein